MKVGDRALRISLAMSFGLATLRAHYLLLAF